MNNKSLYECNGLPPLPQPVPDFEIDCPDRYFAVDSNLTVAALLDCAEMWKGAPCADVNLTLYPVCPLPAGNRANGEPCAFWSQCASLTCSTRVPPAGHPDCGQCVPRVGAGVSCTGAVSCDRGLVCESEGVCKPSLPSGLPPGAVCERFGLCAEGQRCLQFPGQTSSTCQPLPTVGQPCSIDPVAACAPGTACDATGMCGPGRTAGQSCTGYGDCAQGLYCDLEAVGGYTCRVKGSPGESCRPYSQRDFSDEGCVDGSLCQCSDSTCSDGICVIRRDPGQACGEANVVCIPGSACQGGVCAPTGLQGLAGVCRP